jgi:hypothetical protein
MLRSVIAKVPVGPTPIERCGDIIVSSNSPILTGNFRRHLARHRPRRREADLPRTQNEPAPPDKPTAFRFLINR